MKNSYKLFCDRLVKTGFLLGILGTILFGGPVEIQAANPGGVAGLTFQLAANAAQSVPAGAYSDAGCSVAATNGDDVLCWADQSTGGSNNATPVANAPSFVADAFNGFPALSFADVNTEYLTTASNPMPTAAATDPYTLFIVYAPNDTSGFVIRGTETGTDRVTVRTLSTSLTGQISGDTAVTLSSGYAGTDSVPRALALKKIDNTAGNTVWYLNGVSFGTSTDDSTHGTAGVNISDPAGYFTGYVSEFLAYNTALSDANRNKVETYLALKYGFTLDQTSGQDYTSSAGVEFWDKDAVGASTYDNDLVGLVRDDGSGLLVESSAKSENQDAIIQMGTSGLTDGEALVWGNDNGSAVWTSSGAPTNFYLLTRKWSVQETGETGSLTVTADVDDSSFDVPAAGSDGLFYFVHDTDDDGLLSDETPVAMTDQGGGIWSVSSINLADNAEFTLAKDATVDPLIGYSGQFDEVNPGDGEGDGSLSGSIVATFDTGQTAETFALSAGSTLTAGTHFITRNVPAGYTVVATVGAGQTSATLTLTGTPSGSHNNADDVSSLMWVFTDAAFTGGTYIGLEDYVCKIDGVINYIGTGVTPSIAYTGSGFTEDPENDGSMTGTVTITLSDDTFVATVVSSPYVTASNVPTGLTASFVRDSGTQISMTLSGNATTHAHVNDVSNLTVTFLDGAFTTTATASDVTNYAKNDLVVDFIDVALSYDTTTFSESGTNDGSIGNSLVITLGGTGSTEAFTADVVSGGYVTASNVPTGLTASFVRDSGTQITASLTGNATSHENINDVSNLTITFAAEAFTTITTASNVTNYQRTDIVVDFDDAPVTVTLGYSTETFDESNSNDGSIGNTITITLFNDTFVADVVSNPYVTTSNVPLGLTATLVRDSGTQISMSLTGNATSHENANDVSNLTVTFLDGAFTTTATASDVTNYDKRDLNIDFDDAAAQGANSSGGGGGGISGAKAASSTVSSSAVQLAQTVAAIQVIVSTIDAVPNLSPITKVLLKQLLISLYVAKISSVQPIASPLVTTTATSESLADSVPSDGTVLVGDISNAEKETCKAISFTTLRVSDTGDEVRRLQEALVSLGYLDINPDGSYGQLTQHAVEAFQADVGLGQIDGVAGVSTLERLEIATCGYTVTNFGNFISSTAAAAGAGVCPLVTGGSVKLGASGKAVRNLQQVLVTIGILSGDQITGDFDDDTRNAVMAFQEQNGLKPDGIAGTQTQDVINQVCNEFSL